MLYFLLIASLATLFFSTHGDDGERMRFRCPRIHGWNENCIYKGNYITAEKCLELCRAFYYGTGHDWLTEGICETGNECKCKTPRLPGIPDDTNFIIRLTELEEMRAVENHFHGILPNGQPNDEGEVRCGYLETFVTREECHQMCTVLQRARGVMNYPLSRCRRFSRCLCEDIGENDRYFERLDTLEARYRHDLEDETASNVRLWIEMHNGVDPHSGGLFDPVDRFRNN